MKIQIPSLTSHHNWFTYNYNLIFLQRTTNYTSGIFWYLHPLITVLITKIAIFKISATQFTLY